jgi:CRISPR-associated endonuclease/helicase Cas3
MLTYWQLWAKTSECNRWHALPFHLLDVAAAAEVLWDSLPHEANAVAVQAFGDELSPRRICVFFAAAHDIGKANRFFQAKDHSQHRRLRDLAKSGI